MTLLPNSESRRGEFSEVGNGPLVLVTGTSYGHIMNTNTRSIPTTVSVDALAQILIAEEGEIARHRANQIAALELLDRAQVATADGSRTLSEWVAARVDLGHETSNDLVRTMRRTGQRPELRAALADGCASFDRVEAASRIAETGPDHLFLHLDVNGFGGRPQTGPASLPSRRAGRSLTGIW